MRFEKEKNKVAASVSKLCPPIDFMGQAQQQHMLLVFRAQQNIVLLVLRVQHKHVLIVLRAQQTA